MASFIRLIQRCREKIESSDNVKTGELKELASVFRSAIDAQIRLDRTQSQRARSMSTEDYLTAAMRLVMSLPASRRRSFLKELQAKCEAADAKEEFSA